MAIIEESIELDVPVRTAYNQWTQFEDFPKFMEGVDEVRQINDTTLHWKASFGGAAREWDAQITEQIPDERIAWKSTDGATNAGVVTFHKLAPGKSKVMLQLEFDPEGFVEQAGDKLGIVRIRVAGDLGRFKGFLQSRGQETGAWRGEVAQDKN